PPPGWRRPEGADAGFYRSEDQGLTWSRLTGGLPDHITAAPRSTAGDPESPDVFIVGMTDGTVWITEDGGESFERALSGLPPVTAVSVAYASRSLRGRRRWSRATHRLPSGRWARAP